MGASELREIYLKSDNYLRGEYFARLIKVEYQSEHSDNQCSLLLFGLIGLLPPLKLFRAANMHLNT